MPEMADLHYHALLGLDDGAPDLATALSMLAISYEEGVRAVCVTLHRNLKRRIPRERRLAAFHELSCAVQERFPDLLLFHGEEIAPYSSVAEDLKCGEASTIGDTRYVLVEFSPSDPYETISLWLHRLQTMNCIPVLAHVERYAALLRVPERVSDLRDMRVLIQVNADSILSFSGFRTRRFVRHLLRERLVDVVASDAHDTMRRPPYMARAYEKTVKLCGAEYARRLFYTNPLRCMTEKER